VLYADMVGYSRMIGLDDAGDSGVDLRFAVLQFVCKVAVQRGLRNIERTRDGVVWSTTLC